MYICIFFAVVCFVLEYCAPLGLFIGLSAGYLQPTLRKSNKFEFNLDFTELCAGRNNFVLLLSNRRLDNSLKFQNDIMNASHILNLFLPYSFLIYSMSERGRFILLSFLQRWSNCFLLFISEMFNSTFVRSKTAAFD